MNRLRYLRAGGDEGVTKAPRTLVAPSRYTTIAALVNTTPSSSLRTAKYHNREHLIVPVIALLGNCVVRPLGSRGREFVPAEELALAPTSWNGRPLMMNHPGEGTLSANDPRLLENESFGQLFNTRFTSDFKLCPEAWIDLEKVSTLESSGTPVGLEIADTVRRCQAGESVEVSIGAFVNVYAQSGVWNDQPYEYIWEGIVPDHLAMLSKGVEGACSCEMGCGAPRLLSQLSSPFMQRSLRAMKNEPGMFQRFLNTLFRTAAEDEGLSGDELKWKLGQVLYAVEPAFWGVEDYYTESQTVIYATYPLDKVLYWRRTYSVDASGVVTLGNERESVSSGGMTWIAASESREEKQTDPDKNHIEIVLNEQCSCNNNNEKETQTLKKSALIARILAAKRSPFKNPSTDTKILEAMSEEQLSAIDQTYSDETGKKEPDPNTTQTPTQEPTQPTQPTQPAQEPTQPAQTPAQPASNPDAVHLSRAEYAAMKAAADAYAAQQAQRKSALVSSLISAQKDFTEDELNQMSMTQLEKLVNVANANRPRDYSGQTLIVGAAAANSTAANLAAANQMPKPPNIYASLMKKKGE
jgi:hypothetical protein